MTTLSSQIPAEFKERLIVNKQGVNDIVDLLLTCERHARKYWPKLQREFKTADDYETCKRIWQFMKKNIAYQREPEEKQTGKTVARILSDGFGDCKAFATFALAACRACNIPACFRLASYDPVNSTPSHIYCVAKANGKTVIVDGCMPQFDQEARYTFFRNEYPLK